MKPLSILLFVLVLLGAAAGLGYWAGDRSRNNAWLAKQAVQARSDLAALQAAQTRGDLLSAGLLVQAKQIDQLQTEAHHALQTATTGRACLDSAALRVLQHAPGVNLVPAPASRAAAAGGATVTPANDASSDGASISSSDTQVASWMVDVAASYQVCRARLDALIDWYAKDQEGQKP